MASTSGKIRHQGIVDHSDENTVFVKIITPSACDACHTKGMCSVMEMKERMIEVRKKDNYTFKPGDRVIIEMLPSMGGKAVFLGYFLPFLLVIITLIAASSFVPEVTAGLLALGILLPYYLVLFFARKRLSNSFSFHLRPGILDNGLTCEQ